MRVGIITHYMPPHPGGIEMVAAALAGAFRDAGHEVRWLASRSPADAPADEDGLVRVACWNAPEERLGVPWPIWGPSAVPAVTRLVRWADAVHVHDCLYPGSTLAAVIAPLARKPLVLTQHVGFIRYSSAALNVVERIAYATLGRAVLASCDRIVPATPAAEAHVAALVGESPRVLPIANGIETDRFRPATDAERRQARAKLSLEDAAAVALFVGRLVEKKGVPAVLALAALRPDVTFLLVGDGPLARLVESPPPNVRWTRGVAPADMPACYHAADVLVLPSHGEGLPLTVQEALASGLPAVVSRDEAFTPRLIQAGACLGADRDAPALARALEGALAAAREMGAAGRAHAERHWSRAAMFSAYLALLDDVTAPAGDRGRA